MSTLANADAARLMVKQARQISARLRRSRKWQRLQRIDCEYPGDDSGPVEVWENDTYSVTVRRYADGWPFGGGTWCQIGISSFDGEARHDWRDFQNIKNDVCGSDWEGVELFPSEARIMDPSNYYMLWCAPVIPIGKYEGRILADENSCIAPQRGWWKP